MDWRAVAGLDAASRSGVVREHLEAQGLAEASKVAPVFADLLRLPVFEIAADRVAEALASAGSPRRAILGLSDCIERLEASRGNASPMFVDPVLGIVVELSGSSARAARLLAQDPALAIELGARLEQHDHPTPVDFDEACQRIVAKCGHDTEAFDRRLRRFRNRQLLRIALAELRRADVRDTAAQLADLASSAMQAALDHHRPILEAELGVPDPPCAYVVIGMGKLGGRELNFSSDIDVIYLYEHDEGGVGELSMHQFFVKLFERATASLARITQEGFVFRVDLDLRPEGRQGPLANSLASAERYYETWGRNWERAAWIKARPIAGDPALGERVQAMMRPFVYRKSLDLSAIEDIVAMKTKIDAARKKAAFKNRHRGRDLKLGRGGIREIEFYVQAHQLLHGGRTPGLRLQNTLEALHRLEASGLVSAQKRELLANAYLFLRTVEHRVQIVEEQQTHRVPAAAEDQLPIARSLELPDGEALERALARHMENVHDTFTTLLGEEREEDPIPTEIDFVLDDSQGEDERVASLAAIGCVEPHAALANLSSAARPMRSPFHPRASTQDTEVARRLLFECWKSPSVDRAMRHLPELMRSISNHGSYRAQLERPVIARGVARVLGTSDLLARILVANPALLGRVLTVSLPAGDNNALAAMLDVRLAAAAEDDIEDRLSVLRAMKHEELLRTAIADLAGVVGPAQAPARLTRLAEVLIAAALDVAIAEMSRRFGPPERDDTKLAVIAGGTLGARELGYLSDVDLSVIFEGTGKTTGGQRSAITIGEFYTRVVQRLLAFLSMRMHDGSLYPVDMRLRPSGAQGALVVSFENFERYHHRAAQLWERQALLRSRTIAGDVELRAKVDATLSAVAYDEPVPDDAGARIHEMRQRMTRERKSRRKSLERPLDLKLGDGGIVDLEFVVQHLQLAHGREHQAVRTTSTRAAIAALGAAGVFSERRVEQLIEAHDRLRRVQAWLRVMHDEIIDTVDLARLRPLALAVGYEGEDAAHLLERALARDAAVIRETYASVLYAADASRL
ncbi:MAG: bifunctional [glutamate--ammonia ligase]-adenylyl-L-tyrosine phosphorylase/[glutamate--ammonia-ligase] adenylyltransferase [Deltaproteobacteria bacterium]|jgi:glutamate-ammonia-ligase adenylyltransferase